MPETRTKNATEMVRHLEAATRALPPLSTGEARDLQLRLSLGQCFMALGEARAAQTLATDVLEHNPSHRAALVLLIDGVLETGKMKPALKAFENAGVRLPGDIEFLRKRIVVHRRAGQTAKVVTLLEELHSKIPGNAAILVEIAQAHLSRGNPEQAEDAFARALVRDEQHVAAWLGRIDLASKRGDPVMACELAREAVAVLPDSPKVVARTARALAAIGRLEESLRLLEKAAKKTNTPDAGIVLAHAFVLRSTGDFAGSERMLDGLLARERGNALAWLGRIQTALDQGDADTALKLCDEAVACRPDNAALKRQRAEILEASGRPDEAIEALQALHARRPGDMLIAMALAGALRRRGRTDEADDLFREVLRRDPANWLALKGRVAIAEARGDLDAAIGLLETDEIGRNTDPASPRRAGEAGLVPAAYPGRMLRLAEITLKAGDMQRVQTVLEMLGGTLNRLTGQQMATFMRLAERVDRPRLIADAIRQGAGRRVVAPPLADAILQKAHESGDESLSDAVERALAERMPTSARREFRTRAARMREGPDAALALLRRTSGPRRNPAEAVRLGTALVEAGQTAVGLRYLRRCHRRWPGAKAIKPPLLRSYLQSGHLESAREWLAALAREDPAGVPDALQLSFAMHSGEMEEAYAILKTQISEGRRRSGDLTLLRVLLSLDRLEEAEDVAKAIRTEPGPAVRGASHFSIRLLGAILNEFRLYRATKGRDRIEPPSPAEVASHYFAAKTVLDGWRARHPWQPDESPSSPIPRNIFQYWNTEQIPDAVADIMQSWRSVPGWIYRRLDRRGAIEWLRETLGDDYARAFRMANNVAEECDFLRMCLLLEEGGLYVDADDKQVGSLEELSLLGSGLILFVEPSLGSLSNNVILAPKGHPVLERAVEMAKSALLRRDNDSTWLKTGPGMLTRAAALHVAENPDLARQDTALVPRWHLYRYVRPHVQLPYKSTPRYWAARSAPVDPAVQTALEQLAQ